jgi:hypothetical protein
MYGRAAQQAGRNTVLSFAHRFSAIMRKAMPAQRQVGAIICLVSRQQHFEIGSGGPNPDDIEFSVPTKRKMSGPVPFKRLRVEVRILEANSRTTNQRRIIMSEFVYLYRGGETDRSPEQAQKTMQKWMTWMKELGAKGHIKDQGQPLERSGKLVRGKQKSVTDGPFTETKDVVGGYTLIEARDLDQAVELSKGCPIFEVDGAVEVRPVMKMNM